MWPSLLWYSIKNKWSDRCDLVVEIRNTTAHTLLNQMKVQTHTSRIHSRLRTIIIGYSYFISSLSTASKKNVFFSIQCAQLASTQISSIGVFSVVFRAWKSTCPHVFYYFIFSRMCFFCLFIYIFFFLSKKF